MKKKTMEQKIINVLTTENTRADKFIAQNMPQLTRSHIQKLIESGNVLLNDNPITKKSSLKKGDTITITIPPPEILDVKPQDIPIDIVYEDEDIIIVNKPRNMVVHPAGGNPDGGVFVPAYPREDHEKRTL